MAKKTDSEPAPVKAGIEITAKIKSCNIKSDCGDLKLGDAQIQPKDRRLATVWVKNKEPLTVTINEEIVVAAKIKSFKTLSKQDDFVFEGMNFSEKQYQKLAHLIKSESAIKIQTVASEEKLFDDDDDEN